MSNRELVRAWVNGPVPQELKGWHDNLDYLQTALLSLGYHPDMEPQLQHRGFSYGSHSYPEDWWQRWSSEHGTCELHWVGRVAPDPRAF